MKQRWLLILSVTANVGLAAGWLFYARHEKVERAHLAMPESDEVRFKTNVVVRRQFFSWRQLESTDYPTFIANLRAVDCPEQTIRDIIIADVNAQYARRLALEVISPDQQWWRSDTDATVAAVAEAKTLALDDERRTLLVQLLGPGWEGGDLISLPRPTQAALVLDGPVLGILPTPTKESVEQITQRGQQRIQDYLAAQKLAGKDPDPVMLTKLEKQTQTELAAVLSPQQLEEFELRYSSTGESLRNELGSLKYFNATPEEFRRLFHAVEDINNKVAAVSKTDPNGAQIRSGLEEQRLAAIKAVLGERRYADYIVLHDPMYRDAVQTAQAANAPQSAGTIFEINRATALEQSRIASNSLLTAEQRTVEQKRIELEQAQGNATAVGQLPIDQIMPPSPVTVYTLSIGDNLNSISRRTGVSVRVIQSLNPDLDLSTIRPGDKVRLPASQ